MKYRKTQVGIGRCRASRWRREIIVLVGVGAVVSGCASNSAPSSASHATPIKIGIISEVTGVSEAIYPENIAGAQAAIKVLNGAGGIGGHPIELVTCDSQDNPNQATACARTLAGDGVVATVGDDSINPGNIIPILAAAHIPEIGPYVALAATWTDADSYPFGAGTVGDYGACVYGLKKMGVHTFSIVVLATSGTAALADVMEGAAKSLGVSVGGVVNIPLTTSDFSTYAAQVATQHSTGAVLVLDNAANVGLIRAMAQEGLKVQSCIGSGGLSPEQISALGPLANGTLVTAYTPSPQDSDVPGIELFNKQMGAAQKAGVANADNRDLLSLNAWLAVYALKDLAAQVKGPVTGKSLITAAASAREMNLQGVLTWNPAAAGPKAFPRVNNAQMYVQIIRSELTVNTSLKPVNVFQLLGVS